MKTLTTIALSLFSLILTCSASITDDLVGTWVGNLTSEVNGQKIKVPLKFIFKKYQGTGMKLQTIVRSNPKSDVSRKLRKNGKVVGTGTQGEFVITESGTWTSNKHSLTTKVTVTVSHSLFGSTAVDDQIKFRLLKNGKLKMIEKTSTGYGKTKGSATLRRK